MPYIFWIDYSLPRRKFIELLFQNCSWAKIYTLESYDELTYRYDDLSPVAVIVDENELFQVKNYHDVLKQIGQRKMAIIHRSDEDEFLELEKFSIGKVSKIIDPLKLIHEIKAIILKNDDEGTDPHANRSH